MGRFGIRMTLMALGLLVAGTGFAQEAAPRFEAINISPFNDSINHWLNNHGRDRDDPRFEPHQIVEIADNILQYQNANGGWPKNLDWLGDIPYDEVKNIAGKGLKKSTFDNRNTYTQVEYLAKVYAATGLERFRESADRGLSYIFSEQRVSGGWSGADVDAITFNDDVMAGIINLLMDIKDDVSYFDWLTDNRRASVRATLDSAIDGVLKCQIKVKGEYTAWCQQHDHETYAPVKARSYELSSITPAESVGVVRVLMRIPDPSPEVQQAIRSAVRWMEKSAIYGIRLETKDIDPVRERYHTITRDRYIVEDRNAGPLWTRFYEIDTNRPFFCNRDGVKVYSLEEVALERRTGYGWYGTWPKKLIKDEYPAWEARIR